VSMSNEIPHIKQQIEYMTAIEAGKVMKWRNRYPGGEFSAGILSTNRHPAWEPELEYKIEEARPMQRIPAAIVPRALTEVPAIGTMVWAFDLQLHEDPVAGEVWEGYGWQRAGLSQGAYFATREDAEAVYAAMTAREEGE
jgi:hypothetical protein